jgi:hypothetical protein
MKKPIIITIALLLSSFLVKAQDTLKVKSKAQPDSIIKIIPYGEGRYGGYLYTIGGKLQTPEDVKIKLLAYAPSAGEYQKVKNELTWTYVSTGASVLASSFAIAEFVHHARENYVMPTVTYANGYPTSITPGVVQKTSLTGAYILSGIATGFLVATFVHLVHASRHADKAIKLYNQRFE